MRCITEIFGRTSDGVDVPLHTLTARNGLEVAVTEFGATLISAKVPDSSGAAGEVTLGFDDLSGYCGEHPYFGAVIGRFANRIGGSAFTLDRRTYRLHANDGPNHLHGGKVGFSRRIWESDVECHENVGRVTFHRVSPDGEEGYPGSLDVTMAYELSESGELTFSYTATTDAPTPVNLTNHAYWNLDGPGGDVLDHTLEVRADAYLFTDDALIPDGRLIDVTGTPLDFRTMKRIGRDIATAGGYDHCFVLNGPKGEMRDACAVESRSTGRRMVIRTDQPAIQFYTANKLHGVTGRGVAFPQHGALCLETGAFNNAPNLPEFPNAILRPGEIYETTTSHVFTWA